MALALSSCSLITQSDLVREAAAAEKDGRTISNFMLQSLYPQSFTPGNPKYLERDFEAGADMICTEIELKYGEDICSNSGIGWW